jgi:hypothetical protein
LAGVRVDVALLLRRTDPPLILGIWQRQEYYGVKADYDQTSTFLQKHTGNPATSSIPIFEDAVLYACSKAIKPLRGMKRIEVQLIFGPVVS